MASAPPRYPTKVDEDFDVLSGIGVDCRVDILKTFFLCVVPRAQSRLSYTAQTAIGLDRLAMQLPILNDYSRHPCCVQGSWHSR